jgi:hypothetical protein
MNINPYQPTQVGKSPNGGDMPWMAYDWNYQLSNFNGGGGLGNPTNSYTQMANVTYWFRHDITWQDGVPWTVDDFNYTIYIDATYGDSWGQSDMIHVVNFVKWDDWTCSLYFDIPTFWSLYTALYDQVPMHIYNKIDIPVGAPGGGTTSGHHGEWPGKDANSTEVHAPLTFPVTPEETWVGTGMWQYVEGTYVSGTGGGLTCKPYPSFWMNITQGDIDFKYTWQAGAPPQDGSYVIGLSDLVLLANAYGTSGIPPVPFLLGGLHIWELGCDLAPPASVVGLSDLVTLALNYGNHWGDNLGGPPVYVASLENNAPTNVNVTSSLDGVGGVPISVDGVPSGHNTPYSFIIYHTTVFSVPKLKSSKNFHHWDVHASGIGIHAVYH